MDQEKAIHLSKSIFIGLTGIPILLYIVGIFYSGDTIRRLHEATSVGWNYQAGCKNEYMESESYRKATFDAVQKEKYNLDSAMYIFLLVLFIVPIVTLLCVFFLMKSYNSAYYFITLIVIGAIGPMLYEVTLNKSAKNRVFSMFSQKDCNLDVFNPVSSHNKVQFLVLALFCAVVYVYYKAFNHIHSLEGLQGFSDAFVKGITPYQYVYGVVVIIWLLAFVWVRLMTKEYDTIQQHVVCYYPQSQDGYKAAVTRFIQQDPSVYKLLVKVIQQNYFRAHSKYADIDRDNITDYVDYILYQNGRELENLESTANVEELNKLRDFMYQLRNDRLMEEPIRAFYKKTTVFFIVQFVVLMYALFHAVYARFPNQFSYMIIIGTSLMAFILSWIAWFDNAIVA